MAVEHGEEVAQRLRLEKQVGQEGGELFQPSNQQHRKAHKTDNTAHADLATRMQGSAHREDGHDGQRAGSAIEHGQDRPAAQYRILRIQRARHHLAQRARLGGQPGKALHHRDVAEHVASARGDLMMQLLHHTLCLVRALHGHCVEDGETQQQRDHQQCQLPVDRQRHRHHHQNRQQRRQVLAKKTQPQVEQIAHAHVHDARQPSGVIFAVERQWHGRRVLEKQGDGRQASPVGQPIRMQGDPYAGQHAGKADTGPQRDQAWRIAAFGRAQRIHDLAEQYGLQEKHARQREVGERQRYRQLPFGRQQPDDP